MDLQFKTFPFEVKGAAGDGSTFEGLSSVFYNLDSYNDIVDDSSFTTDLPQFLSDGFIGGLNHDWDNPIGTPQDGTRVVEQGLFLRGNVIDTSHGLDVRKMLLAGVVKKLSIGYSLLGSQMLETADDVLAYWASKNYTPSATDIRRAQHGARLLTRIKLYEASPVTVPANDLAAITAVKAAAARALLCADPPSDDDAQQDEKGATGSTTLPLAARDRAWDSTAAEKRVREWADAGNGPNVRYRRAFFWYDASASDQFGSYKMQFADVIGGTLTAVPRAIFACSGVMMGARGGVDIPEADRPAVMARISRYYARMREAFNDPSIVPPWEGKAIPSDVRGIEDFLRDVGGFSQADAKEIISNIKALQRDAVSTADAPAQDPEPQAPADVTPAPPIATEPGADPTPPDDPPEPDELVRLRQRVMRQQYERFLSLCR